MPGIEVRVACSGSAMRAGGSAAEENGGGGAPLSSGQGGGVGELREVEAQLMEGSAREDGLRRGGSTAASSSPVFGRSGGCVLGSWVGEMAKERGERVVGLLVVLLRVKDRALGCYSEPSTAAARWQPVVVCCCVTRRGGHSARDISGGELRRDAWAASASKRWLGEGPERRQQRRFAGGEREQRGRHAGWRWKKGLVCNFRNSRDPTVNQQ